MEKRLIGMKWLDEFNEGPCWLVSFAVSIGGRTGEADVAVDKNGESEKEVNSTCNLWLLSDAQFRYMSMSLRGEAEALVRAGA